jgi:hypothetical protein
MFESEGRQRIGGLVRIRQHREMATRLNRMLMIWDVPSAHFPHADARDRFHFGDNIRRVPPTPERRLVIGS